MWRITSRSLIGSRPGFEGRAIEHVHQNRAALDVTQKFETEALAFAGTLDQTGDVGERCIARRRPARLRGSDAGW